MTSGAWYLVPGFHVNTHQHVHATITSASRSSNHNHSHQHHQRQASAVAGAQLVVVVVVLAVVLDSRMVVLWPLVPATCRLVCAVIRMRASPGRYY